MNKKRIYALDLLRVVACYLVIQQHASEFYYIGENGSVPVLDSTYWIGIMSAICRTSVPLFVMVSGYLLLPMSGTSSAFFRKRFTRILYPFLIWCVAYAVYFVFTRGNTWAQVVVDVLQIPINFGTRVGHLWYIYMLIGLYLLVPVLSPWLRSASKRELQGYLGLWALASCLPYIHLLFPEVLGECFWNPSPLLYYFTGFSGYLVLGFYLKQYGRFSLPASVALLLLGYGITAGVFCARIPTAPDVPALELSWGFCTINVAMASAGLFSLFQALRTEGRGLVGRWVTRVSSLSYGMYLGHIMVLNFYYECLNDCFYSVLVAVPVISLCSFITVYLLMRLLSLLPGSKYIVG